MMTEEELADMVEVKTNDLDSADFILACWTFQPIFGLYLNAFEFQDADRDGSGSMDFQEFVEMMIKVMMMMMLMMKMIMMIIKVIT